MTTPRAAAFENPLVRLVEAPIGLMRGIPLWIVSLMARLSLAVVFWASGRTKVAEGTLFSLSENAVWLFQEEYKVPLLPPELAAYMALTAEHLLPVLLVVGFASRFAALGLLGMTLVIQAFVYPAAYPVHGPWSVCCLVIMIFGPGWLSLDRLVAHHFRRGMAGVVVRGGD
jgi:putative oxidoreductase